MDKIRTILTLTVLALGLAWSRPALADITITGTVGEIGILSTLANVIRFKLTDLNQTATCTDQFGGGTTLKYAYFTQNAPLYREWYAAILYSKKGAPITCTVLNNTDC